MAASRDAGNSSGWPQVVAALLAAVAFALGVVGTVSATGGAYTSDAFYRSLQLFVMEGDALQGGTQGSWQLELARFLAPVSGLFVIVVALRALLGEQLRRRRIARTRKHAIVCGDGPAASALARNLRGDGRTVVLIEGSGAQSPRRDRIAVVTGDPRLPSTLRAAGLRGASQLYACAAESATNAAVVLAAGPERAASRGRFAWSARIRDRRRGRLAGFAQVRNDDLVESLRVRQFAGAGQRGYTVDFFAIDDSAARLLIDRHPPGDGPEPVVIVGFPPFGQALIRAIVRRPPPRGQRRTLLVRTDDAATVREFAAEIDAGARGWDVTVVNPGGVPSPDAHRFYVCDRDEDSTVAVALRLARRPGREVVACLPQDAPFGGALESIHVFGILDAACHAATIADDSIIGRAAVTIHEKYLADCAARGDRPATNPSMLSWQDLPPHLQESNIAQAEHIGAKLFEIGVTLGTDDTSAVPFAFTDDEVTMLARYEHRRWVDERLAAGFTHGPRREGRQHPDLVDWPALSPESQQKDVDAVRHLPDLLAAAGLYIARRPDAS